MAAQKSTAIDSPPARVAKACRISTDIDVRSAWTEPSANTICTTEPCGEKKSYGSLNGSCKGFLPTRDITITGANSAMALYTGAPGVVRQVPPVMTPDQGVWVKI